MNIKPFFVPFTCLWMGLTGCTIMEPIGKPEFACPNEKKGGVCAGPRTIYELTNSRENLEDMSEVEDYDGYFITTDEDGQMIAVKREDSDDEDDDSDNADKVLMIGRDGKHVYVPRDLAQQLGGDYQTPQVIPQLRNNISSQASLDPNDPFRQWPNSMEPLAPEPLSLLEPPKVMRILVNSYKDAAGNLYMPGYLYVQVEEETWAVGEAAPLRPQRVVPVRVRQQATQNTESREYREQGVAPLEYQEANGG